MSRAFLSVAATTLMASVLKAAGRGGTVHTCMVMTHPDTPHTRHTSVDAALSTYSRRRLLDELWRLTPPPPPPTTYLRRGFTDVSAPFKHAPSCVFCRILWFDIASQTLHFLRCYQYARSTFAGTCVAFTTLCSGRGRACCILPSSSPPPPTPPHLARLCSPWAG